MSRRPVNSFRRSAEDGFAPIAGVSGHKSRATPLMSVGFIIFGGLLLVGYFYRGSGGFGVIKEVFNEEGVSCTSEVQQAIPILKKAYGDSMNNILHVGPESCTVVYSLWKDGTEAWGIEPYDLDDADSICKSLVRKGIVRTADIKFSLPYKPNSFSLVIVSDVLDYLSPKYVNTTLLDLARVSKDGVVVFTGFPGQQKAKISDLAKYGRPAKFRSSSWWIRFFSQIGLEANKAASKKFDRAASKMSYQPSCQTFHLTT